MINQFYEEILILLFHKLSLIVKSAVLSGPLFILVSVSSIIDILLVIRSPSSTYIGFWFRQKSDLEKKRRRPSVQWNLSVRKMKPSSRILWISLFSSKRVKRDLDQKKKFTNICKHNLCKQCVPHFLSKWDGTLGIPCLDKDLAISLVHLYSLSLTTP